MSVLGGLQLILLAGLLFAVPLGLLVSASIPLALASTETWSPERRHRALLIAAIAPTLVAVFGVLSVLAPSLLSLFWPEYDHCLSHGDHHVHLCLAHLPHQLGGVASWLVSLGAVAWATARAVRALGELRRAMRCAVGLRRLGLIEVEREALVLPTAAPVCLSAGLFRPVIYVSRGLLAGVTEEELDVILAHERAHASRRDTLARVVARAGSVFLLPSARARLLRALELAAEQSCDEAAAERSGDRWEVAATIVKVEGLLHRALGALAPVAASFGGNTVDERVRSLLAAPRRSGSIGAIHAGVVAALCGLLAVSAPLHHLTESLLGRLTH